MSLIDKDYQIIEKYLQGRLDTDEKVLFKQRLDDPDFREEYEFQEILQDELFSQKRDEIVTLLKEEFIPKTVKPTSPKTLSWIEKIKMWLNPIPLRPVLRIGIVAVLLGLGILYWQSNNSMTNQALYTKYYQPESSDFILIPVASTNGNPKVVSKDDLKEAYDAGNHQLVLQITSALLKQEQDTIGILLLAANSHMQLGQMTEAIDILQVIVEQNNFPTYVNKAKWYQALAYLKIDKVSEARSLLKDLVNTYRNKQEEAKVILEFLEKR